jgi:hypothetical protein
MVIPMRLRVIIAQGKTAFMRGFIQVSLENLFLNFVVVYPQAASLMQAALPV